MQEDFFAKKMPLRESRGGLYADVNQLLQTTFLPGLKLQTPLCKSRKTKSKAGEIIDRKHRYTDIFFVCVLYYIYFLL